jgi:phage/plasmid-like protein (TIGR03299 family)
MSHDINYNRNTGQYAFMSVKEKAWHGLGQLITDYPTSAEAILHAGLDYTVEKRPLFTVDQADFGRFKDPDADDYFDELQPGILVPDYYANVRTDTEDVLGVVGKDYSIVQNREAFAFFDNIVGGKDGILYETAGALGKGERIFISAKLPDYIRVGRDDCIEKYIFLTTSHDGYGSITAAFTPMRVVCRNTLNAALRNQTGCIKIRHTSSAPERLKQAHRLLGLTNQLANELEQVFNQWAKIRITDQQVKKLVQLVMAPSKEVLQHLQNGHSDELSTVFTNVVESVCTYALTNPTQQMHTTRGTLYGAYNAVSGYYQNVRSFKDEESKFKSIMYGTGLQRSQSAFDLCSAYAKSGVSGLN